MVYVPSYTYNMELKDGQMRYKFFEIDLLMMLPIFSIFSSLKFYNSPATPLVFWGQWPTLHHPPTLFRHFLDSWYTLTPLLWVDCHLLHMWCLIFELLTCSLQWPLHLWNTTNGFPIQLQGSRPASCKRGRQNPIWASSRVKLCW